MITYKVFTKQKLVSVKYTGEVTFQELLDWHNEIFADPEYKMGFDGLFDYRNCLFQVSGNEISDLATFISSGNKVSGKSVHLTDSPLPTALVIIYKDLAKNVHDVEVFSTINGVSAFLGYDVTPYISDNIRS